MRAYKLLIDGKLVDGAQVMDVINPANEEVLAKCPRADEAQVHAAVAAAKAAFPAWSTRPQEERVALLAKLASALEARAEDFARTLTAEQGKPLPFAMHEVHGAVGILRVFPSFDLSPEVLIDDATRKVVRHRAPLGVVAAITPWNFPMILMMLKVAPALFAGNTMVVKPAPTTPLTTLMFGELAAEILPPGVLNVIADQNDLGGLLTSHPDVAKVAFTGSTATGKKVMASAASTIKRITLELGGNDAAIVLDDCEPKAAAASIFNGAMFNAGQVCVAVKRAYVPEAMYEAVCEELARLAGEMVVDDGMMQGAQMGPLQNKLQFEKVKEFLADAHARGKVIAGGAPLDRAGYFIAPTIVRDMPDDSRLVREEQFGPVLPVMSYTNIEDVIARANDSDYGLAGSVWGRDVDRAYDVATRIQSGTIWVNKHLDMAPDVPFGGAKQSGFGVEMAQDGLDEYTQSRVINMAKN